MRASSYRLVWIVLVVIIVGIAAAIAVTNRPMVTLRVLEVSKVTGAPVARVEFRNESDKPVDYYVHSLGHEPAYDWLERYGQSWHHALWDTQCGIDLEPAILAPGQTLSFKVSIIDTSSQTRLALSYRQEGTEHTTSTKTIVP